MDAMGVSRTSSSTVNTTMVRSRLNDAIWRDISDRRLAEKNEISITLIVCTTKSLATAIVFSAGTFSNRNEVHQSVRR